MVLFYIRSDSHCTRRAEGLMHQRHRAFGKPGADTG